MALDPTAFRGKVDAVALDAKHAFSKTVCGHLRLIAGHGVEGDAHAGACVKHRYLARRQPGLPNARQVHLLPQELFDDLEAEGVDVEPGHLGENVTTSGLALERLPLGTLLALGPTAVVALSGLRTPCALIDRFQAGLKRRLILKRNDIPYRCGVFGIVKNSGIVTAGDRITVVLPERQTPLPML